MSSLKTLILRMLAVVLTLAVSTALVGGCSTADRGRSHQLRVVGASRFPGASTLLARRSFVNTTSVPATVPATEAARLIAREVPSGHGDISAPGAVQGVAALLPVLGADSVNGPGPGNRVALRTTGDYLVVVHRKDGRLGMFVIARASGSRVWSFVGGPGDPSLLMRAVASSATPVGSFVPVICDDGRDSFWVLAGSGPEAKAVPVGFPPEKRCWAGGTALRLGQAYSEQVLFTEIVCK